MIASSSTAGVWVENRVQPMETTLREGLTVLVNSNSLLSNRMEKSGGNAMEVGSSYCCCCRNNNNNNHYSLFIIHYSLYMMR